jgi:hypothetical protein
MVPAKMKSRTKHVSGDTETVRERFLGEQPLAVTRKSRESPSSIDERVSIFVLRRRGFWNGAWIRNGLR